jgi:putative NADH-flavin reductase
MRVVVFGATGGVGRRLVEAALTKDYWVTAAVRDPARLTIAHPRLQAVRCDVLDPITIGPAVARQDAVLCALGAENRGPTALCSDGGRNIVQQMLRVGVRRIVFLSNFGVLDEKASGHRQSLLLFLARRFLRHTLADHRRAIDEIRRLAPEWIIVRPLPMNDGPPAGAYRVAVDDLPPRGTRISRADVADFMLRQVTSDEYLGKIPSIAC